MLSKKSKQYLRSLANHLKPIVIVGKDGISEKLVESLDVSLEAHELVKVSLLKTAPLELQEAAIELAVASKAEIVQTIGKVIVLYRKSDTNPQIVLPK